MVTYLVAFLLSTLILSYSERSEAIMYCWCGILIIFLSLTILFLIYQFCIKRKKICFELSKGKNYLIAGISIFLLIGFFILAKNISGDFLTKIGCCLPLPLFTFFIALIDGFNPCNLFVLTLLLGLLISVSHSRKRIYTVGYTYIFVVMVIYFLFMVAWLNIFKFIGFITPLRIVIALIALIAGAINCKELFFFRKGISLMIPEREKSLLFKKERHVRDVMVKGSLAALVSSSVALAAFASLVELPCTAGFPIIYTGILTGKVLRATSGYYLYLLFYNLIYIVPLAIVIGIFGYTFKGRQITKEQMQIIKFIGGAIMILLGIILLVNPGLLGLIG